MRTDDFAAFYEARKQSLLALIEKVMGKKVLAADDMAGMGNEEDEADILPLAALG